MGIDTSGDFIGKEFITPKGAVLKVTESLPIVKKRPRKFITVCSICSEDVELFPYGSLVTTKGRLDEGKMPCNCTKIGKWSEDQLLVLLKRILKNKGYDFLGYAEDYKGKNTKIRLYSPKYQVCWDYSKIVHFINEPYKDWLSFPCKNTMGKDYSDKIKEYKSIQMFYTNYELVPLNWMYLNMSNHMKYRWNCSLCGEYGFIFDSQLQKGEIPCSCNENRIAKTPEEKLNNCLQRCEDENLTFLTKQPIQNIYQNISWLCSKGHKNFSTYNNFTSHKSGCYWCVKGNNRKGYYPERKNDTDYLYVIKLSNDSEEFIKVGRSFNVKNRLYAYKKYNIELLCLFKGIHDKIYYTEQYLIYKYSSYKFVPFNCRYNPKEMLEIITFPSLYSDLLNYEDIEHV